MAQAFVSMAFRATGQPHAIPFDKGLTFRMGQTHVHRYLPELLEHIEAGRLNPEAIVTHRLALEDAVRAYELFDEHQERCRKVIMVPGAAADPSL